MKKELTLLERREIAKKTIPTKKVKKKINSKDGDYYL